ncbi:MAG: response regulator [Acidobacteria bacterium]|nr:response regulator [Acidobacteriota bacterium]
MSFRVLIVDDSPAMRNFVRRVLEVSGFPVSECFQAGDGEEALEKLRAHPVDVILSDINMPKMDGEQFLRRFSADTSLKPTPVVVVSTDGTDVRMQQMMALGAKGYVKKPFQLETLREVLEQVMGVPDAGA